MKPLLRTTSHMTSFHGFFPHSIARWLALGVLVGVISGLAAVAFFYCLQFAKHLTFGVLAGYQVPAPAGETLFEGPSDLLPRRLIFFFLPIVAGLLSGLLVYSLAPEAEGHGTDAMIDAFHNKRGKIRPRVPFLKAIATIITLGGGGSAGREGPIAQMGAGLGSILSDMLRLSDRERRILLLAGCGGGLSAIFRAPLGGALTSVEVLYREDFEAEALIPTIISSITAFIIFTGFFGTQPIFSFPDYTFHDPRELLFYVALALVCIPLGIMYVKIFYATKTVIFAPLEVPRHFKPMLGGLGLAIIGLCFPQVYGDGWGWIQLAILGKLGIGLMALLVVMKILATSLTISSGGSGGVFGPTLFIGGMIGGVVGFLGHMWYPDIVTQPGAFVVVGMGAFFAGVANAPIGSLLMCSEMTQGYGLIAPLMLVSSIAIIFTRNYSIYQKQVKDRFHSPAHFGDLTVNVLAESKVKAVFVRKEVLRIPRTMPYGKMKHLIAECSNKCLPVYSESGKIVGGINWDHARPIVFERGLEELLIAEDLMTPVETLTLEDTLYDALLKFLKTNQEELLVVSTDDPDLVLGTLSNQDLASAYRQEIIRRKDDTMA